MLPYTFYTHSPQENRQPYVTVYLVLQVFLFQAHYVTISFYFVIKYRKYFTDASPNQIAEGVVFRTEDMTHSFKVVSNKYLLKGGE